MFSEWAAFRPPIFGYLYNLNAGSKKRILMEATAVASRYNLVGGLKRLWLRDKVTWFMGRQAGSGVQERRTGVKEADSSSLSREQLVEFYRLMYLSRRTDDREIVSGSGQQKIFFSGSRARGMRHCS